MQQFKEWVELEFLKLMQKTRLDEREACAKLAESMIGASRGEIATAIRARGNA